MDKKGLSIILFFTFSLLVCPVNFSYGEAVGTAFTYQGRLIDANAAADGLYDFQFRLFDSNSDGKQAGSEIDINDVDVIDGYFTVELDFNDANAFNGEARWLEIGVVPSDSNGRTTVLSPRQEVTPAPYAIYAANTNNDGDWVISGDDMYSVVSGEVGIGTAPTGAGKLQVVTSSGTGVHGETEGSLGSGVSGIASNTGNVITYGGFFKSEGGQGSGVVGSAPGVSGKGVYGVATNPNDVTNYGGYFYAAGGTGRGVYGKTISGDGYAGYFEGGRNYFEGNVGIGVVEPAEKLEVDGNIKVSGDIAYSSAKMRYLSISSASFVVGLSNMDYWSTNGFIMGMMGGEYVAFVAPIYLPHGAELINYTAHITDNNSTNDITIKLLRQLPEAGVYVIANSTLNSTGAPGSTTLVSPTLSETIDNATQAYLVEASWITPATPIDIHLNHINICYTINEPLP